MPLCEYICADVWQVFTESREVLRFLFCCADPAKQRDGDHNGWLHDLIALLMALEAS